MSVLGREWGLLLAREVNRRSLGPDPASAHPMASGQAAGLDALQVASAMTWLMGEGFVQGQDGAYLLDPYTEAPLELTDEGLRYLEANPRP